MLRKMRERHPDINEFDYNLNFKQSNNQIDIYTNY